MNTNYHHNLGWYQNHSIPRSYVQEGIDKCIRCKEAFTSPTFNTTKVNVQFELFQNCYLQEAIHCFEFCLSSEARLGYTLTFLLMPIIFYLSEFLTLTDRYEVRDSFIEEFQLCLTYTDTQNLTTDPNIFQR